MRLVVEVVPGHVAGKRGDHGGGRHRLLALVHRGDGEVNHPTWAAWYRQGENSLAGGMAFNDN